MNTNGVSNIPVPELDRTFVVIDMQPQGFIYASWVIKPILQRLETAMRSNHGICLVEYIDVCAGAIAEEIMLLLEGYARIALAQKKHEDGSAEVIAACDKAGLSTANLELAGVTTDDCVTKTARGLSVQLPSSRIEVIRDCCLCWQGKRYDWSTFAQASNIFLV